MMGAQEELSVIDRRGGHSRSYAHLLHRLVHAPHEIPCLGNAIGFLESKAQPKTVPGI